MFIPKYGKTKKAVVTTPGPPKTTPHPVPTETGLIIAVTGHRPEKLGGYGDNPIRQNVRADAAPKSSIFAQKRKKLKKGR